VKTRLWLPIGGLVVLAAVGGAIGVRVHQSNTKASQLASAHRVAREISVPGASPANTCPDSPTITCLATGLTVRAATDRVAASMNSIAHTQPGIRCFDGHTSLGGKTKTHSMSCIVDLTYGSHRAFAWINPTAATDAASIGSTVSISVS
jgi:hypothetical protein